MTLFWTLHPVGKNDPHIHVPVAFFRPDGVKHVAKNGAVERPLMAVWRWANLPYFGKISENGAYSPQELKKTNYRVFLV
mgnify:CR=1 FL=1